MSRRSNCTPQYNGGYGISLEPGSPNHTAGDGRLPLVTLVRNGTGGRIEPVRLTAEPESKPPRRARPVWRAFVPLALSVRLSLVFSSLAPRKPKGRAWGGTV